MAVLATANSVQGIARVQEVLCLVPPEVRQKKKITFYNKNLTLSHVSIKSRLSWGAMTEALTTFLPISKLQWFPSLLYLSRLLALRHLCMHNPTAQMGHVPKGECWGEVHAPLPPPPSPSATSACFLTSLPILLWPALDFTFASQSRKMASRGVSASARQ